MILYYIDSEWTISIIRSLMSLLDRNHDIQEDHPRIISQSNLVRLDFGFFHLLAAFTGDQCMIFFEMLLSLALIERLWALVAEDDVPKAEGLVHEKACQVDLLLAIFNGKKNWRFINPSRQVGSSLTSWNTSLFRSPSRSLWRWWLENNAEELHDLKRSAFSFLIMLNIWLLAGLSWRGRC